MLITAALWEIIKKKYFGALNAVVGVILKVFLRFLQPESSHQALKFNSHII